MRPARIQWPAWWALALQLRCEGKSYQTIANALHRSKYGVRYAIQHELDRLGMVLEPHLTYVLRPRPAQSPPHSRAG